LIEWQESLSVGVLEIDIQHKLLFERVNTFLDACQSKADNETVHRLFWFLEAYAVTHFAEEEKLMQQVMYPDYVQHRRLHQEFVAEVGRIKKRLKAEGPTPALVSETTKFVSSWLIQHISRMDRAIGQYMNQRSHA